MYASNYKENFGKPYFAEIRKVAKILCRNTGKGTWLCRAPVRSAKKTTNEFDFFFAFAVGVLADNGSY